MARDAPADAAWRSGRRYLAAQARVVPVGVPAADVPPVTPSAVPHPEAFRAAMDSALLTRVGLTVGKRNARRAVDRALVKRVLRESARHALPVLDAAAATRRVDVVLRLKAPLPARESIARAELKRQLRHEADSLLAQLAGWLRATATTSGAGA